MQDYGAPVGWRLALTDPDAVVGVVSQNGNAYEEGFVPTSGTRSGPTPPSGPTETRDALRPALGREAVEWQYTHGVPDPTTVDPDAWEHDLALLARPGQDDVQLALFRDYATNRALYPAVHHWLRASASRCSRSGAQRRDLRRRRRRGVPRDAPDARVELVDGGHFLLESHLDQVAATIREWLPNT